MNNTSEIMALKIVSETGVAAGVRRIEALTSEADEILCADRRKIEKCGSAFKSNA